MSLPIKTEKDARFTDSQWQAIYDSGKNILVSASAGSGKTTVLVKRVIEKIKNGTGVDQLLIVTFTEAAAKEMKGRIEQALKDSLALANGEERAYFQAQLDKLPMANISTLDAFCLNVIQRYYYLIGLDPKFRMLTDKTENTLLKEEVWDDIRQKAYEEPLFQQLTNNFSSDRNDEGLANVVLNLADYSTSHPYPEVWLRDVVHFYDNEQVLALIDQEIMPLFQESLAVLLNEYDQLIEKSAEPELLVVTEFFRSERSRIADILELSQRVDLNLLYQAVEAFTFPTIVRAKKLEPDLAEFAKGLTKERATLKDNFAESVKLLFPEDPRVLLSELPRVQEIVAELSQKTQRFLQKFSAKKRELNLLDFADLEHLAFKILQTTDSTTGLTIAKDFYQAKFVEVMVDEYQDINQLQDAIITAVSRSDNAFMVGDVKQSIYSFRLAEPSLFIDKYQRYQANDAAIGTRILLQENFRSRKEVLNLTNLIFTQLMDEKVGQLAYDEAATLKLGNRGFPESSDFKPELLIYEKESGKDLVPDENFDLELDDKAHGELSMVATKINALIDSGYQIFDKELQTLRAITYADIVLLAPTRGNNLTLLEVFKTFNIPVVVNDAENYFQASEVKTMLAMLEIIDNPLQDIPLVAVLRSAIVGLNETELAEIRCQSPEVPFYEALLKFSPETPTPLLEKVTRFKKLLDDLRTFRTTHRIAELIWKIYQETFYYDYVAGLPEGLQRQANLTALANRATAYEEMSYRGLFQFINFLKKMQEKAQDLAKPNITAVDNAVQVMTIHGSKGLEFPVVFLLDMNKSFNLTDLNERAIFEKNSGIGISFLDEERVRHTTYPRVIIWEKKKRLLLSEEMRKLYVALTRAEQKLFLVGSYPNQEKMWASWQKAAHYRDLTIPATLRLNGSSFMDWVGYTLIRHPQFQKETLNGETLPELAKFGPVTLQFYQADQFVVPAPVAPASSTTARDISHITPEAQAILGYVYPFAQASQTASYQSVTEVKQLFVDPDEKSFLPLDNTRKKTGGLRFSQDDFATPQFLQGPSVTAATVGTATHKLMQLVSLKEKPTAATFANLADQLIADGLLQAPVVAKINFAHLATFFDTALGQEILANAKSVQREQPFSLLIPANELFAQVNFADDILIHGIIDGYFKRQNPDATVIFDFKTDKVSQLTAEAARAHFTTLYAGQLNLYAKALSEAGITTPIQKFIVALDTMAIYPL